MDELFEDYFERSSYPSQALLPEGNRGTRMVLPAERLAVPMSDFWETDSNIMGEIDLPGLDKKEIQINVVDDSIEIRAQKKAESHSNGRNSLRVERSFAGYYRRFALPKSADPTQTMARLENGVLKLTIPKRSLPSAPVKQIEVQ
jgi:HSP20 family protein